MQIPDLINGCFELCSGILLWLNVIKTFRDKRIRGVSIVSTMFFTTWGYWNLFYYPHLNQWLSFIGGISLVFANTVWVAQMIYYTKKERNVQ